jgi:hypothetical protein
MQAGYFAGVSILSFFLNSRQRKRKPVRILSGLKK